MCSKIYMSVDDNKKSASGSLLHNKFSHQWIEIFKYL